MRFGVGDFSGQRPALSEAPHATLYSELFRQAEVIEEAGLDSMWLSEHHFADDGYMPAVIPLASALLARTQRIVVATDRLAASLHDPIRLAEDAIALDLLSGGRFVLGLSLCYRDVEFAGFGVDPKTDVERLEALVPELRAEFAGNRITPSPFTPGGPPLMIAADGENGAERAARFADMMMVDPTEPWSALDEAIKSYDTARGDDKGEVVIFVYGGLSQAGQEAAWQEVDAGFRYMRHTYDHWMGKEPTREIPPPHYRLLLGTAEEVAGQAREYARRYGDRVHLVLRCNYPGMRSDAVDAQIRLWAEAARLARQVD